MRVALVVPTLEAGGAERVTVNLANGLAARGHDVHLLVGSSAGPFAAEVGAAVTLHDLGRRRFLAAVPSLARNLLRLRPDALIASMLPANVACAALRWTLRPWVPAPVLWEHTVLGACLAIDPTARPWHGRAARWAYPRTPAVVVVSDAARDDLIRGFGVPGDRVVVVQNPLITPGLLDASAEPAPLPWADDGAPLVAWVGRLESIKDPLGAVRALHLLRAHVPARMVMLGDGVLAGAVDEEIARLGLGDVVARPGFVGQPLRWVRRADVLLSSSLVEGLGNVMVEALAVGTPVVATRSSTTHDDLLGTDGPNRIVPVGDVAAMAEALAEVLAGRDRRAHSLLGDRFTVERAAADFERLLAAGR